MNNKIKYDDILNDLFQMKCKDRVPIIQFRYLINNIKRYLDICNTDNKDDYYIYIYDIYHNLLEISTQTTTKGNVKKIVFNHLYNNIMNKKKN
jgi:hypothetical protein